MPVIIVKPGIISEEKQAELSKAGYIIIEVENPKDIEILDESPSLKRDLILGAAIDALGYGNEQTARLAFGNLIRKRLSNKS